MGNHGKMKEYGNLHMKKPRDFQRKAVYVWENSSFTATHGKELTIEQCKELIADACKCYGVSSPTVVYPEYEGKKAYYDHSDKKIVFPKWSRHRHYVWHELAHYIHHVKNYDGIVHGPKFFGIYAYLLNQYNGYSLEEIFQKADKMGIKYDIYFPRFACSPKPSLVIPYS